MKEKGQRRRRGRRRRRRWGGGIQYILTILTSIDQDWFVTNDAWIKPKWCLFHYFYIFCAFIYCMRFFLLLFVCLSYILHPSCLTIRPLLQGQRTVLYWGVGGGGGRGEGELGASLKEGAWVFNVPEGDSPQNTEPPFIASNCLSARPDR